MGKSMQRGPGRTPTYSVNPAGELPNGWTMAGRTNKAAQLHTVTDRNGVAVTVIQRKGTRQLRCERCRGLRGRPKTHCAHCRAVLRKWKRA